MEHKYLVADILKESAISKYQIIGLSKIAKLIKIDKKQLDSILDGKQDMNVSEFNQLCRLLGIEKSCIKERVKHQKAITEYLKEKIKQSKFSIIEVAKAICIPEEKFIQMLDNRKALGRYIDYQVSYLLSKANAACVGG